MFDRQTVAHTQKERWKEEIKRDDILFLCLCLCLFSISILSFSSFLHHFLRHSVDIVASLYRCAICNLLLCQMPFPHSSQKIITSISHRCRHVKYTYIYIDLYKTTHFSVFKWNYLFAYLFNQSNIIIHNYHYYRVHFHQQRNQPEERSKLNKNCNSI